MIADWTMSPLGMALAWTMLRFLWIGGLIGLVVVLGYRRLQRSSPNARYLFLLLGFLAMVLAAALIFSIEWQAATDHARLAAAQSQSLSGFERGMANRDANTALPRIGPELGPFIRGTDPIQDWLAWWLPVLPWLWMAGTLLSLSWIAIGMAGGARMRARGGLPGDVQALETIGASLAQSFGLQLRPQFAWCDPHRGPLVVGILKPLVLIPTSLMSGLSPAQLEMVLLHELAHVKRWDNLVNLLQRVVEALLFFQPAIWWVSRQLRIERENCCDAQVLAHTGRPVAYARTLMALHPVAPVNAPALSSMAGGHLVRRIACILQDKEPPMRNPGKTFSLIGLSFMSLAFILELPANPQHGVLTQDPVERLSPVAPDHWKLAEAQNCMDCHMPGIQPDSVGPKTLDRSLHSGLDLDPSWHAGLALDSRQSCLSCHAVESAEIRSSLPEYHAELALPTQDCSQCHSGPAHTELPFAEGLRLWHTDRARLVPYLGTQAPLGSKAEAQVSPNGKWLLYTANPPREWMGPRTAPRAIYLMSLITGEVGRVSPEQGHYHSPVWSPDSRWIYFQSRDPRSGQTKHWAVARTKAIRQLEAEPKPGSHER